jgi:hypothetical protein
VPGPQRASLHVFKHWLYSGARSPDDAWTERTRVAAAKIAGKDSLIALPRWSVLDVEVEEPTTG